MCLTVSLNFHSQSRYLASVTPLIKLGGRAVMMVFSNKNVDPWVGPRRISETHARAMWTTAGWQVDSVEEATYMDNMHNEDGRHAILMKATRIG